MKIYMRETLFGFLLLSALFPWSPSIFIFTDLQPTPIVFSIIYLVIFVRRIPFACIWAILALVAAVFLMLLFGVDLNSIRGVYPYFLFVTVMIVTLDYLKFSGNQLSLWVIYLAILVWFVVSVVQFQNPEFGNSLISRAASTALSQGRGTSSLAPEPTFYAIQMLTLSIAIFLLYLLKSVSVRDFYLLQLLLFFQILLFSRSALVIVVLVVAITFYCIFFNFKYFIFAPLLMAYIWYQDIGRLGNFLNRKDGFIGDQSFSDRISQIFYAYYNSVNDFLMPHGFNSWQLIDSSRFEHVLGFNSINTNPRVLSLSGSVMYELGILGLPLLAFILVYPFISLRHFPIALRFGVTILIFLLTLNAVPLALPMIPIVYALFITIYHKNGQLNNESNLR